MGYGWSRSIWAWHCVLCLGIHHMRACKPFGAEQLTVATPQRIGRYTGSASPVGGGWHRLIRPLHDKRVSTLATFRLPYEQDRQLSIALRMGALTDPIISLTVDYERVKRLMCSTARHNLKLGYIAGFRKFHPFPAFSRTHA